MILSYYVIITYVMYTCSNSSFVDCEFIHFDLFVNGRTFVFWNDTWMSSTSSLSVVLRPGRQQPRASRTHKFVGVFSKTRFFFNFLEKPGFCQKRWVSSAQNPYLKRTLQNPYLTRTKPIYKIWVLKNPVLLPKPRFSALGLLFLRFLKL